MSLRGFICHRKGTDLAFYEGATVVEVRAMKRSSIGIPSPRVRLRKGSKRRYALGRMTKWILRSSLACGFAAAACGGQAPSENAADVGSGGSSVAGTGGPAGKAFGGSEGEASGGGGCFLTSGW